MQKGVWCANNEESTSMGVVVREGRKRKRKKRRKRRRRESVSMRLVRR